MVTIKTTAGQTAKAIATLFVACGLIFSSCKKGDTGPKGATGAAGTNGTNGNANVLSTILTSSPSGWNNSGQLYYHTFSVSEITDKDNDLVMVYVSVPGIITNWYAMPTSSLFVNGDNLGFSYTTGSLEISYSVPSGTPNVYTWEFKVVVIPPTLRKAHPNTNHNNYAEVKAAYGLKD